MNFLFNSTKPIAGFEPLAGYRTVILTDKDIPPAQTLMEECLDFFLLVGGLPPAEDEGRKLFRDLPPGKDEADKTVFGLLHQWKLVGVIDSVVDYPEEGSWFIGLFLLHPDMRGSGVGKSWLEAFLTHARDHGAKTVRLGVVEQNLAGRRFWEKNAFILEARRPPARYGGKDCVVLIMRREL